MTTLKQIFHEQGPIRTVGVIGMGYVGIPAAALFAHAPEYSMVFGFQRNSPSSGHKIATLNAGELPLKGEEPGLEVLLKEVISAGKFLCTDDFSKISECDAVTLAIQTPFKSFHDLTPDLSALEEGIRQVGRYLRAGMLVVLESTITPGTTSGWAREILEQESGLIAGEDFGLAHAPERVMVGRLIRNIEEHDRIVGGIDPESTKRATALYTPVLTSGKVIPMTSAAAEVTKTAENTFRDLQIAAANQLALYCEAMGVNFYDVRAGIDSLKGEGITRAMLWPGAGVGGHCLTKDTYHLERGVTIAGVEALDYPKDQDSLFVLARKINDFMPDHMFHLLEAGFSRVGKTVKDSTIAMLGWSFLANTDDARNTPAEPLYRCLVDAGAKVRIHDPWVTEFPGVPVSSSLDTTLSDADAVLIVTGHREYLALTPDEILHHTLKEHPILVDGRNLYDPDACIDAGFIYKGIGRGDKNLHAIVDR